MWADTLLAVERAHLIRLIVWGGASLLVGSALLGVMRVRGHRSALLDHFGIQTAAWGGIDLALGVGGFIVFGGQAASVRALTTDLVRRAGRRLLLASDLERGAGCRDEASDANTTVDLR